MQCPKCKKQIEDVEMICPECGHYLGTNLSDKKNIIIGSFLGLIIVLLIFLTLNRFGFLSGKYFFPNNFTNDINVDTNAITNQYETDIEYNHIYYNIDISSIDEAKKLIINDSIEQKNNCSEEIIKIEDRIISKYNITAVNLCEINYNLALELENILKNINDNYPKIISNLTNITIVNSKENFTVKFVPMRTFTISSNDSNFPWTIKTEILLNANYYLNPKLFDFTINHMNKISFYPNGANKASLLAHEIGHYLSYLVISKKNNMEFNILLNQGIINNYQSVLTEYEHDKFFLTLIDEAYEEYKKDTNTTMSLYDFRSSISKYAIVKNNNGEYVYSETIAEAFHDICLNGSNATDASKYIIKNINRYLER